MPRQAGDFTNLVPLVVSELRGINFDFESEEDAAERIIEIVLGAIASKQELDPRDGPSLRHQTLGSGG